MASLRPEAGLLQALCVEEAAAGGGVAPEYLALVGPAQLARVGPPRAVPAPPVHPALLGRGRRQLLVAAGRLQALEVEGGLTHAAALHLWRIHQ